MAIERLLRKVLTAGLILSLASFALSYAMSLFGDELLSSFTSLFATLVLAFTPLISVIFIAVEETRRRNYGGLMIAALVMLVVIASLMFILRS